MTAAFRPPCLLLLAAIATLAPGCKKTARGEDPAFGADWDRLAGGTEPLIVGDAPPGAELLDSVRRVTRKRHAAARPEAEGATPAGAGIAPGAVEPTPQTLGPGDLDRVVRGGMIALKQCYRMAESNLSEGGGKAIVRFTILPSGGVEAVHVTAPEFESSRLPSCVSTQIRTWRFPTFAGQPMDVSYPIVFIGN